MSPYSYKITSMSVFLPTPDGPTNIRGLCCNGYGLNGWKYSFAYTKTSSYSKKQILEYSAQVNVLLDSLTGLESKTDERKSLSTSLISGWSLM